MRFNLKALAPHLIAIGIFLIVSLIYCKPALEGKQIEQHDLIQWKGMAQDAFNYQTRTGEFPLWTNSLFSGMPTYNIAFQSNAYLPAYIIKILSLFLPEPFSYFFLACICFYFLSQVLRVNPLIGILGAIGFAYCSYDPIIIAVGHHTKMITMALMPGLLGALLLLFQKKYLTGGALVAAITAAIIANNHLQIIYYMMIVVAFCAISFIVYSIRNKEIAHMVKAGTIGIAAAVLGALTCSVNLFTTYDYSKESMRGGKAALNLTTGADSIASKTSGLDAEYAFRWSYGKAETLSLLIPNVNGGASKSLGEDSKFYESLMGNYQSGRLDQQAAQAVSRFGSEYWGDQPFTSGPVYLGAIICFLFLIGMFTKNNEHRWWILACSLFAILLSWGHNFSAFNNFLFNHLPLYNKFRAPSVSLVIPQLLFPIMGIIGLNALLDEKRNDDGKWKTLKLAGMVIAGIFILALGFYFASDFRSETESETIKSIAQQNPSIAEAAKSVLNAAGEDRKSLFFNDFLRSAFLVAAAFGLLFAFTHKKMKAVPVVIGLIVLCSFDLLNVGKRYLNDENFQEAENTEAVSYLAISNKPLYDALSNIAKDTDPHYRVLNYAGDVFNDALTSAMVRSVGGYHPAKLSIYQDLIENQLSKGMPNMQVLNMLDTRYIIVPGGEQNQPMVQQNPAAYGPAWFVKHIQFVPSASEEMKALDFTNLKDTAIVQEMFKPSIAAQPLWDSAAYIKLDKYDNNEILYTIQTASSQFAVISDIYYERGWKAFADGKELPIVKTNYVLRGVAIPAGTKKLELKFEPESYKLGSLITTVTSGIVAALLLVAILVLIKRKNVESSKKQ